MKPNKSFITIPLILTTISLSVTPSSADSDLHSTNSNIELLQRDESQEYSLKNKAVNRKDNVKKRFKQFYIYGSMSNPSIDLSNKNSLIKTFSQANNILLTKKDGKKTDRQVYLDAWNSLTSKEKAATDMKNIQTSYNNIIKVTTAAKSVFKFYEDVKANKDTLISNPSKSNKLNSKTNNALGARGKAYDDYTKATKVESKSKSKRLAYINEKYLDTVYFLNISKFISSNDKTKANEYLSKIKDSTLKSCAEKAIKNAFLTTRQEEVTKKFKQFYLYGSESNPSIDLTNKNSLIKSYTQAVGMLKTTEGDSIYDRQKFLNAYSKLSSSEKKHPKMIEVKSQYDNMITILEAAKSVFKFYEDVKADATTLILNPTTSNSLNSKENLNLGARGKAYNDYMKASTIEPSKSSKRVAYLNQRYNDTLHFLSIPKYIKSNNTEKALEILEKVTDTTLRKVALDAIYNSMDSDFVVTPNSNTFKNNMMNRPSYNEYTKHYYLIRSYLEELDSRGGGTLTLKAGTYNIPNTLFVPSNVTIILDGATLKKTDYTGTDSLSPSKSIFQVISPSKASAGIKVGEYDGEQNIKFIGKNNATIDMSFEKDGIAIIMGHNRNVEISGLNFINMNGGHFIELDASKDVIIRSNTFKNSVAYGNLSKEAINLDIPDRATGGWSSEWSKFDKTPNINVYIENNFFSNLDRALGTHKYTQGKYHTNIYVRNNTIEKTRSDSIRVMNWKDSFIENNIIRDINSDKSNVRGILASGAINPTIKNNTFINMPRAMQFFPTKNTGGGSEYEVTYNQLSPQNKIDIADNIIENVSEDFVRINEEYNIFDYPEKIYFFLRNNLDII